VKFPKAIIFDFDGVILESTGIKTQAFLDVFSADKNHLKPIIEYHLNNMGISRHEKFRYIYKNILKRDLSHDREKELAKIFSISVWEKILDCPEVPGITNFLKNYSEICLFFIASGTPEDELKEVVKKRQLNNYFSGVFGSPKLKPEIIRNIMKDWNLKAHNMLFIGDAITDLNAAKECNLPFIGRAASTSNDFTKENINTIKDFNELIDSSVYCDILKPNIANAKLV